MLAFDIQVCIYSSVENLVPTQNQAVYLYFINKKNQAVLKDTGLYRVFLSPFKTKVNITETKDKLVF